MTFSLAVIDSQTGAAGVACATGSMAVGGFVPHVRAGIGAIATQGERTNWLYGECGLTLLETSVDAPGVLKELTDKDSGRDYRQCIVVDRLGQAAGWTGDCCEPERGHVTHGWCAAAGNRLAGPDIGQVMIEALQSRPSLDLSERLLIALRAGEAAGGDTQGVVSAALKVDYLDRAPLDLRVDYQPGSVIDALTELHTRYQQTEFKAFCDALPTRLNYSKFEK